MLGNQQAKDSRLSLRESSVKTNNSLRECEFIGSLRGNSFGGLVMLVDATFAERKATICNYLCFYDPLKQ
jgi:hypothetical protein